MAFMAAWSKLRAFLPQKTFSIEAATLKLHSALEFIQQILIYIIIFIQSLYTPWRRLGGEEV
jgi:hypothetical protein